MTQNNEISSRKDSTESVDAKQTKGVLDLIRKPNQEIDKLKQNLKDIKVKLEKLTKELDKIKEHIINETPNMKIQKNYADELKESKLKITTEIVSQSKELNNLEQDHQEMLARQTELNQKLRETEGKKRILQSLQRELENAEKSIQRFLATNSQHKDYQSIKRVIEVLKKANAEIGNHQEKNNDLPSIEDRLKHLEEVNTLIRQCKAPLEGTLLKNLMAHTVDNQVSSDQEPAGAGPSELRLLQLITQNQKDYSSTTNQADFNPNQEITRKIATLKTIKQTFKDSHDNLTNHTAQFLDEVYNQLEGLTEQIEDARLIAEHFSTAGLITPQSRFGSEYIERHDEFIEFVRKLDTYQMFSGPGKIRRDKFTKLSQRVEATKTKSPARKNLSQDLSNDEKREQTLASTFAKFDTFKKYQNSTFETKIAERNSILTTHLPCWETTKKAVAAFNIELEEVKEYYSQEFKKFLEIMRDQLPKIRRQALEAINGKTLEETEAVNSINMDLSEISSNCKSIAEKINQYEHNITTLESELNKTDETIEIVMTKFKELFRKVKPELKNSLKEKQIQIQTAETEKAQIQEELKKLEQASQSTQGESSVSQLVVEGAMKSLGHVVQQSHPS